jgi:hypothetical protein
MRNGDRTIKINKDKLLAQLRENAGKHQEAFALAKEGFLIELRHELQDKLRELSDGEPVELRFKVHYPDNHYPDYLAVIEELEWDESETIELDRTEFQWYVQDQWHWRDAWFASNTGYITTASAPPSRR